MCFGLTIVSVESSLVYLEAAKGDRQSKEPWQDNIFVCLCLTGFFVPQNQPASTLGSTLLRCDKLDQSEIKSLLMCFLHVLKSMSEGNISLHLSPALSVRISELTVFLSEAYLHVYNLKKNKKTTTNVNLCLFQMLCSPTGTRLHLLS